MLLGLQSTLNCPSGFQPATYSALFNPEFFSPRSQWECQTAPGDFVARSSVPRLFCSCGPLAILAGVRPVIIDAIYRVLGSWARSHVLVEVLEGLPTLTDKNSSSTVSSVCFSSWVHASLSHASPYSPFWRAAHTMSEISRTLAYRLLDVLSSGFSPTTTTTDCGSAPQSGSKDYTRVSTVANASPSSSIIGLLWRALCPAYDQKSPVSLAHEIHRGCVSNNFGEVNA